MFSTFHVFILCIVLAIAYRPTNSGDFQRNNKTELQRVLLVTAHPDDECLFFAPTILGLTSHNQENFFSLCLSIGDADGLGHIRREEYDKSLDVLGISKANRMVLDDPSLKDGMDNFWDPHYIADVVAEFVALHNITTILTFDGDGVSGHPNHKAIPYGIQHMISTYPFSLLQNSTSKNDSVMHGIALWLGRFIFEPFGWRSFIQASQDKHKATPVFVAGIENYLVALRAMRQHWSQLVWFRWLNVLFSSYMWVNRWGEVIVDAAPIPGDYT
ncbi:putative deacetylase LmbE-like domain-containing protein, partial [Rhodocollybia butyracea]